MAPPQRSRRLPDAYASVPVSHTYAREPIPDAYASSPSSNTNPAAASPGTYAPATSTYAPARVADAYAFPGPDAYAIRAASTPASREVVARPSVGAAAGVGRSRPVDAYATESFDARRSWRADAEEGANADGEATYMRPRLADAYACVVKEESQVRVQRPVSDPYAASPKEEPVVRPVDPYAAGTSREAVRGGGAGDRDRDRGVKRPWEGRQLDVRVRGRGREIPEVERDVDVFNGYRGVREMGTEEVHPEPLPVSLPDGAPPPAFVRHGYSDRGRDVAIAEDRGNFSTANKDGVGAVARDSFGSEGWAAVDPGQRGAFFPQSRDHFRVDWKDISAKREDEFGTADRAGGAAAQPRSTSPEIEDHPLDHVPIEPHDIAQDHQPDRGEGHSDGHHQDYPNDTRDQPSHEPVYTKADRKQMLRDAVRAQTPGNEDVRFDLLSESAQDFIDGNISGLFSSHYLRAVQDEIRCAKKRAGGRRRRKTRSSKKHG